MRKIQTRDVNLYYGDFHALKGISIDIFPNTVSALIGPSGCGKSTFLRLFNRMNDLIDKVKIEGNISRDRKNNAKLKKQGWKVIRLWEKEILFNIDSCINRVIYSI